AKVSLLTEVASVQKFAPGSDVVRQGEEGSSFFIIRSGSAVVVKENEEDEEEEEEELLVLKKGDFFGERSLLTDELRSATVRADTQLVVLEVTREQFDRLGLREELDFHGRKSLLVTHLVNAQTPAEKTREDLKFIRDSVARNENLSNILDVRQMPHFADPAWKEEVQVGQNVIEEGDVNADFFYVVRSGEFQILIDGSVTGTLGRGDCFGELSLICSAPRTATVRATAISTLWVLPRGWLKSAAEESARLASKLSMVYLNQVRTLDVLLQAEKEMLAPLLAKVVFKKNDSILRFGEEETSMYILAEGTVRVEDDKVVELEAYLTENQQHLVVHTFGERALIGDGFNSDMSVKISSPEATCYRLDGVDFISMLGSIEEILQQSRRGLDFQGLDTDAPMNTSRLVQFRKKDLQRVSFLRAGQFGNLELWCHTLTGVQYMVKAVSKGYIMEQGLQKKIIQERDIMMMLDSSFTISLFQTFTGEQMLYFLMETALGGDLYTAYLKNALHGSQRHAVFYSALVVLALEHLHGKKVAYRDLKPENVLLSSTGYVKLVDFSLAKVVIGRTYTIVGTPEYLAPEMIGVSGHNQAVDWWALGIFIFELLSGQTPFEGSNPMQTFGKTMAGVEKVTFSSKVSSGARRLIEGLLKRSPAFRLAMKKGGVQNVKDADWYGDVDWSLLARSMTEDMRKLQMQAEDAPLKGLSMETANFHSHEQRKAPFVPFEDDGSGWAEAFASWNMKSENVEF
ncbi:cGMP-dependent protein kinase egl-4 (Egg-laying defective protein 4), partial [Durusdinium trenchii]